MTRRTTAEAICFWPLAATWPLYAAGALYIAFPALAWILGALAIASVYFGPAITPGLRATGDVPASVWGWIAGMLAMLLVLWLAHIDWDLGAGQATKSTIGWAKGWALLALLPLAGSILPIRRVTIARASNIAGLYTLLALPIMLAGPYIGLPSRLYTSPLAVVGGPGPEYFGVYLFTLDPSNGAARWQFFAPWSPFAGLLGVMGVVIALEDRKLFWRFTGIAAGLAMIFFSKSRMSMVALVICVVLPLAAPAFHRGTAWKIASALVASLAISGTAILRLIEDGVGAFNGARADSTRVRAALQRIAYDRWQTEAWWFGHGTVEPGPHIVEYMPIGSHHTWFGLLFVKGVAGVIALAAPMLVQFWLALSDAVSGRRGRMPLGIMLLLLVLTLGENIEIEAYLLWPALLLLGVHAREVASDS